ncbi:hypothetical protein Nans01_03740 [Nocardiopsis ansamitocini]|uniref:Uncharacterized protein n=1 Tax=Nocardiopsis ansamitocini TaxID=1670832 RepID=A0A9W6UH63_9ACTN|nr:hypothetical protein Nans01_03740 [Nocardiopsis ansamitocini]
MGLGHDLAQRRADTAPWRHGPSGIAALRHADDAPEWSGNRCIGHNWPHLPLPPRAVRILAVLPRRENPVPRIPRMP